MLWAQVWPAFRDAYVWDVLRRYFRLRLITPSLPYLDTSKPMLAAQFPHAVFSMGFMLTPPIYGLPGTGQPTSTTANLEVIPSIRCWHTMMRTYQRSLGRKGSPEALDEGPLNLCCLAIQSLSRLSC